MNKAVVICLILVALWLFVVWLAARWSEKHDEAAPQVGPASRDQSANRQKATSTPRRSANSRRRQPESMWDDYNSLESVTAVSSSSFDSGSYGGSCGGSSSSFSSSSSSCGGDD